MPPPRAHAGFASRRPWRTLLIACRGLPLSRVHLFRDTPSRNAQGRGRIEENEIYANLRAGVAILREGAPFVTRNKIYDGYDSGVLVCEHGMGSVVNNEIFANFMAGVAIGHGGASTVKGNMIRDGSGGSLLCLSTQTRGLICANVIDQDASASLQVRPPPFESETAPPLHAAPLHTATTAWAAGEQSVSHAG